MTARTKKVLHGALIIFLIGALYRIWIFFTHKSIPCVFRLVTGFKCPGCGVSAMFINLLKLNFRVAFRSNMVLFCLIPLMAFVAGRMIYKYIKTGRTYDRLSQILVWVMIVILLAWGIVRNII